MTGWLPQETIRRKRDGGALSAGEIERFVAGIADGGIADAQIGALAMAILLRGMERAETVALTEAMTRSGSVLDWSRPPLPGPILDKHSTGGVGDKVSLMLAPIVAACGGFVPMVAGRGLGHTGGTIDKLESIPGYRTAPGIDTFRQVVREAGCAIIGQTAELAPADRRLYAIRDVTATVESVPLITASILSKKLAEGLDALVLDVKCGSGAFMAQRSEAEALARSLVEVGEGAGLQCEALLTDMDEVLGTTAGNAVEVAEAVAYLTGARRDPRLHEVTLALAAAMLRLGGLAADGAEARRHAETALSSGTAAERFQRMVAALGGPSDLVERPEPHLPAAPVVVPAPPPRAGIVGAIDVRRLGLAVLALGGGRRRPEDAIDPAVGLTEIAGNGAEVGPDRPLALIHARSTAAAELAAAELAGAYAIAEAAPPSRPVVLARIGG